ncbi:MAG: CoA transferase, partial [Fimbriimonadaceae bacterium]|nr:CoA transferase [Alphaproteobacteria bacterium]
PSLVYCSISGFGQTGPYAPQSGYDFMVQGMGGIMSVTGERDGDPMKVAVGIADVMCGMYASTAILAALRHRDATGEGQYIDIGLADTQVAWLINEGTNYLTSGKLPVRRGNAHPNVVPYEMFPASDGYFILAVGNDRQFRAFCNFSGVGNWADDPRFLTNSTRVVNRDALSAMIRDLTAKHSMAYWLDGLAPIGVPCGPINDLETVFNHPQFLHRGMRISMDHALAGDGRVELIGNPLKFSRTPVEYRRAPPFLGEHTAEVLDELLELDESTRSGLEDSGIIQTKA